MLQPDNGLSRASDPLTSIAAAGTVAGKGLRFAILAELDGLGWRGATSEELAEILGVSRETVAPRLRPMERTGLVCETSERRTTKSGCSSIVWISADLL